MSTHNHQSFRIRMRTFALLILGVLTACPSFARQADREGIRYVGSRAVAAAAIEWQADHVVDSRTGIATVYGTADHHRRTSGGERYDRSAMTAAHPNYPFDSMVRVTNLETGRRIVVRVNDRLHADTNAVIRLSESAAQRLGIEPDRASAEGEVRIELLSSRTVPAVAFGDRRSGTEARPAAGPGAETRAAETRAAEESAAEASSVEQPRAEARPVTSSRNRRNGDPSSRARPGRSGSDDSYTLQIGAFSTLDAARRLAADVDGAWVMQVVENGKRVYRVYFGQFEKEQTARAAQDRLKEKGRDSFLRTIPS